MLTQKIKQLCVRYGHELQVLWWFLRRPITRGSKCLVICDDKVLLVRPSYSHRKWTIPGGGVKQRETFAAAATRELLEKNLTQASRYSRTDIDDSAIIFKYIERYEKRL